MDTNIALCRRLQLELFEQAKYDVADELVAADFVDHEAPAGSPTGPASAKRTVQWLHSGLDDIVYTVEDVFGAGDRVALRCLISATHARDFFGVPATNRRFTVQQTHVFRVADGKVAEHWANRDDLGMMRQLGAV